MEKLYKLILSLPKLDDRFCIVFVYNSAERIRDKIHATECITPAECSMITESFRCTARIVYAIDGEIDFAKKAVELCQKYKYVMVYSMAQDINGVGRRSLIPLLCEYYNFANLSANFLSSTFGGSKMFMHKHLGPCYEDFFPETNYIQKIDDISRFLSSCSPGRFLLKPDDESASIGIKEIQIGNPSDGNIFDTLVEYGKCHSNYCIQEFIDGDEVEVSLLKILNEYYCPGICRITFHEKDFLDYDTVNTENYGFEDYPYSELNIIKLSVSIASKLGFNSISRIDYRIRNNHPYIIDLGANPTISEFSSTNYMFRKQLHDDKTSVYRLLVYKYLIESGLFKPSFD